MKRFFSTLLICFSLLSLFSACKMQPIENEPPFITPYLMRGVWANEEQTAVVNATQYNIIMTYPYFPGGVMNLEQILNDVNGMYKVKATNTMVTVRSDELNITLCQFVVNDNTLICIMNGNETIRFKRIQN